jgi:RND family efflux transporter MFP subunit
MMAALLILALAGCGDGESSPQADEAPDEAPIPVEVATVRLGSISAAYAATATLEADAEAQVVPRIGGQVVERLVEEGDPVNAGDVMARIDDDRLRLELVRAEAELSRLRQDLNRQREMHERSMIATEAFDRLRFEVEAQEAQVELARLELSYADITAPIDGVVSRRMVKVGNRVNNAEPAFVVTALEPLIATLNVPERELSRLKTKQTATVRVDALPGESFSGRIERISPVVDATSGTFRVTVELTDHGQRLRPGMFGRFQIVYDNREDVVLVPVAAVMSEDARESVFVVEDGEAERRSVTVGYRNNGDYEIVSGVEPGDRVVVTGQASLASGARVQVLDDAGQAMPEGRELIAQDTRDVDA